MSGEEQSIDGTARGSSCEVGGAPAELDDSRVIAYDGAGWDGVRVRAYKTDGTDGGDDSPFAGVTRRLLAAPDAADFDVRYFELDPGGHSTYERHQHVHVVICMRGRGRVRIGPESRDVGFGDVVYVAPDEPHQFRNPCEEPFGFLCIVNRERDRPEPVRQRAGAECER